MSLKWSLRPWLHEDFLVVIHTVNNVHCCKVLNTLDWSRMRLFLTAESIVYDPMLHADPGQGRSQKFIVGGYRPNFLLHDTTVLYTSSLTTSTAISAQNNFQGLILGGYIYRYTPVATPLILAHRSLAMSLYTTCTTEDDYNVKFTAKPHSHTKQTLASKI